MLLETLCNTNSVSGNEDNIRKLILKEIKPYVDDIKIDSMGNIIALKKGENSSKKVMLSAHMDEVGFIVSGITENGYLKFKTVGGIDTRVIISKKVIIADKIKGIIGMKAIHLQKPEERKSVPPINSLFIDIGASSKEEAQRVVSLGDYVAFDTKYKEYGGNKVMAKALDDRVGCYALLNIIKESVYYDTYFCFLVQEETGLRGALICAYNVNPDIALVFEGTTCADVYGTNEHEQVTKCGGGVAISFMDRTTIVNKEFLKKLFDIAKKANISAQFKNTTMGGNDAGAIHISREGVLTASLSVPCRYLHSPVSIASKTDIIAMQDLGIEFLKNIKEFI